MIGKFVICRTYSAGVHTGYLQEIHGTAGILKEARRLWKWTGAFTLNEVANDGCGEDSRISNPVKEILLTEIIEVIPCTEKATANLRRSRNQKQ